MDCSMPGFPVLHYLPELAQTHVHHHHSGDACYAPSPYLRTDRESKSTTVLQTQEGSLFIPSTLGPKSHPTRGNPTRAPNKGVWWLIYRQFFVSVTGVAGITCLARQDEHISCLFLVNMTQVLEPVVWSLTMPSNHLILCCSLLLLPSIFPNIRVFSKESALCISWPKYWSFSLSINLSSEY